MGWSSFFYIIVIYLKTSQNWTIRRRVLIFGSHYMTNMNSKCSFFPWPLLHWRWRNCASLFWQAALGMHLLLVKQQHIGVSKFFRAFFALVRRFLCVDCNVLLQCGWTCKSLLTMFTRDFLFCIVFSHCRVTWQLFTEFCCCFFPPLLS